jgi:hypothetical protein
VGGMLEYKLDVFRRLLSVQTLCCARMADA